MIYALIIKYLNSLNAGIKNKNKVNNKKYTLYRIIEKIQQKNKLILKSIIPEKS